MRLWPEQKRIGIYRDNPSSTRGTLTNILVVEKADDRQCIQILQSGQILLTAQQVPA